MRNHKRKTYRNILFAVCSLVVAVLLSRIEIFHSFLLNLGNFGYIGAFFAGALFVSTFTAFTGSLILLILAETLMPIELGLVAGLGAVIGDLVIFRFIKDGLADELNAVYNKVDSKHHLKKLFHTKYFNWTLPVIGAIIIASPLPDELGVSLMGISKMSTSRFILISYILNSLGIFIILSLSTILKP